MVQHGKLHREDLLKGQMEGKMWSNGKRHRYYGPAVEDSNGDKIGIEMENFTEKTDRLLKGQMEGKSGIKMENVTEKTDLLVEYSNGDKYWYRNGECHREDGPSIEKDKWRLKYGIEMENFIEKTDLLLKIQMELKSGI